MIRSRGHHTGTGRWILPVYTGISIMVGMLLHVPFREITASFFHFTIAAMLMLWFSRIVVRRRVILLTSPVAMVILLHLFYFSMNAVKYYDPLSTYPWFNLSLMQRFGGSMVAAAVIAVMLVFFSVKGYRPVLPSYWLQVGVIPLFSLYMLGLLFKSYLFMLGYGATYWTVSSAFSLVNMRAYSDFFLFFASSSLSAILSILGAVLFWQKTHQKGRLFGFIVILTEVIWAASVFRSRSALFTVALVFVAAMQIRHFLRSVRLMQLLFAFLLVFALMASNSLLGLLGRETRGGNLNANVAEMTYRFGLTDFAVALLETPGNSVPDFKVATDAVISSVPRFVLPMKDKFLVDAYNRVLWSSGWPVRDYTDTLFSAGAMAFGWWGFLFWPILYIIILSSLTRSIVRLVSRLGTPIYAVIVLTSVSMYIELGWNELFLAWRNAAFGFMFVILLMVLSARDWRRVRLQTS